VALLVKAHPPLEHSFMTRARMLQLVAVPAETPQSLPRAWLLSVCPEQWRGCRSTVRCCVHSQLVPRQDEAVSISICRETHNEVSCLCLSCISSGYEYE
jgi:hypothetical protein